MRVIRLPALVLLCIVLTLSGCVSTQPNTPPPSPYQRALIAYVEASIVYEAAVDMVVAARSGGLISDQQWEMAQRAAENVAGNAPKVRAMLAVWKVSGEKPGDYDAMFSALLAEIMKLQGVKP